MRLRNDPAAGRAAWKAALMADGLSDERLERIEPVLRRYVDDGELPGYMLSISRRGREALFLAGGLMDVERGRPASAPFAGVGFGLGFSVALDPVAANVIDSPGQFAWGGLAGTYFWVDPLEELSVIFFAQLIHSDAIPASPPRLIRRRLKPLIYQALID